MIKKRNFVLICSLVAFVLVIPAILCFPVFADFYQIGGSGGGGGGGVTEVATGTGLTGGPITSSGTISVATSTANTLAGYNNSGVFSDVAIGTGLSLSSGTLSATGGGGGVSSFTGDGTVLSNSASTGTVTATLATAAAYSALVNNTSSSAAPIYAAATLGANVTSVTSGTVTLTAASPSYQVNTASLTASLTYTLPQASTCPNKQFYFVRQASTAAAPTTITVYSGDTIIQGGAGATVTSISLQSLYVQTLGLVSTGSQWIEIYSCPIPTQQGGTGSVTAVVNTGNIYYSNSSVITGTGTTLTSGGLWQCNGAAAPTVTVTPGSSTSLTSITVNHYISGGSAPTIAAGTGAGTSPTVSIQSGSSDTSGVINVTTGTTPTASAIVGTITFAVAYAITPNGILLTPANAASDALATSVYVPFSSVSSTIFTINSGLTALTGATTYQWYYRVCG